MASKVAQHEVDRMSRLGIAVSRIEDPFFCEGKVSRGGNSARDVDCLGWQGSPAVEFPAADEQHAQSFGVRSEETWHV